MIYPDKTQFVDRIIQVPLQLIALFLIILQCTKRYDTTYEELRILTVTDELTGIYNRSRLNSECENSLNMMRIADERLLIIMTDIDGFKYVNDTYGHLAGDAVLIEFSKLIEKQIGALGTVGRWGGEEFMIILPGMEIDNGFKLAEELKNNIDKTRFSYVKHMTASFGIISVKNNDTLATMINRADSALYAAKRAGKNTVICGD